MTTREIEDAERLLGAISNGGDWRSMRDGNQAVNISSQYPFIGDHCGASVVEGLPRAWSPHFVGISVFTLPKEFSISRFRDADADFIAAAPRIIRKLLDLLERPRQNDAPPDEARARRARLDAFREIHERWEFDGHTETTFDAWLHEEIRSMRRQEA